MDVNWLYKLRYRLTFLLCLVCFVLCAQANGSEIVGVYADSASNEDRAAAMKITAAIAAVKHDSFRIDAASAVASISSPDQVLVALGPEALETLLRGSGLAPTLALYCNFSSFHSVSEKFRSGRKLSAIYNNPDPQRQLALIRLLYGASARVGIWSTPIDSPLLKRQKEFASAIDLDVTTVTLDKGTELRSAFAKLGDVNTIYLERHIAADYRFQIDQLLLQSYELYHLGVIGYSPSVIKAGGLATTFSTEEDVFAEAALVIPALRAGEQPIARFPSIFRVAVNPYIARSLNISVPNESELGRQIQKLVYSARRERGLAE